jgi:hypothetical protein
MFIMENLILCTGYPTDGNALPAVAVELVVFADLGRLPAVTRQRSIFGLDAVCKFKDNNKKLIF